MPPEFTNLYALMQTDLTNFEATLDANWNGTYYPDCQFAAVIELATDGGEGAAISNAYYFEYGVLPYLNALQGMGIKAAKVSLPTWPPQIGRCPFWQREPLGRTIPTPSG